MAGWQPAATAPEATWIRTRLEGEDGENVCCRRTWEDGEVEWIERASGYTTVTHHSFVAPSHWRPLNEGVTNENGTEPEGRRGLDRQD